MLLILRYFIFTSNSHAVFMKRSNPILGIGQINQWDNQLVSAPRVVIDKTGYKMWYTGFNGKVGQIGLATSNEGINWIKFYNNPVLTPKPNDSWEQELGEPSVIFGGNTYTMWFSSFNFSQKESFRISRSSSSDGINWSEHHFIFTKSSVPWEAEGVNTPEVVFHEDMYKLWYGARDSNGTWRIGYATSPDGFIWTRNANPVLEPTLSWEANTVAAPSVYIDDNSYHMWYHAGVPPRYISHATSTDGIYWTKDTNHILTIGNTLTNDFDDTMIAAPRVIRDAHKLRMYYAGHDGANWRIGLAEDYVPFPYFSQANPEWGDDTYDHADNWSGTGQKTVAAYGCALTSVSMILKYFNVTKTPGDFSANTSPLPTKDLTPGTLNEWMRSQNDGSFRNGATNWLLVSRLTRLSHELDPTSPQLEYHASPTADLSNALSPNSPVILDVNHPQSPSNSHFVVATEQSGDSYSIKDPFYTDRTTLAPYYETIRRIGYYTLTNSDFSYIAMAVDPKVSLTLSDSSGNLHGSEFLEYPLFNESSRKPSGAKPLKVLYLKQPKKDSYQILITSPTLEEYRLDVYFYDQDANVEMKNFSGVAGKNDTDTYSLIYNPTDLSSTNIDTAVNFKTLRNDLHSAFDLKWITNKTLYKSLLLKTEVTERYAKEEKTGRAIDQLKRMERDINSFYPRLINLNGKTLLLGTIYQLINSLQNQ